MNELLKLLTTTTVEIQRFALARVVATWGSSPRPVGSMMIIHEMGNIWGSVSGGCVENEVIIAAKRVIASGTPELLEYGIADEEAWTVGLSCGGQLLVWVEAIPQPDDPDFQRLLEWKKHVIANQTCYLISKLDAPYQISVFIAESALEHSPYKSMVEEIKESKNSGIKTMNDRRYFIHYFPSKPILIIIGAAHLAVELTELATGFGFETIVIDPRLSFTEHTQFKALPDQMHEAYPSEILPSIAIGENTYVAILSHDPKIDDDALRYLLQRKTAYIGALGSKKTHQKRVDRLRNFGFSDDQIGTIHAPIGLSIHAKSAAEIALSIMAELILVKNA